MTYYPPGNDGPRWWPDSCSASGGQQLGRWATALPRRARVQPACPEHSTLELARGLTVQMVSCLAAFKNSIAPASDREAGPIQATRRGWARTTRPARGSPRHMGRRCRDVRADGTSMHGALQPAWRAGRRPRRLRMVSKVALKLTFKFHPSSSKMSNPQSQATNVRGNLF